MSPRLPTVFPGQAFGRLTVNGENGRNDRGRRMYHCSCACGKTAVVIGSNLRNGNTKSCGCLSGTAMSHGHTRRGESFSPTYQTWRSMITRCTNENQPGWKYYGARGITICDRWRNSFEDFLADMGERPEGKTIDRINNDGDYEPGNCRWATWKEQRANQRVAVV